MPLNLVEKTLYKWIIVTVIIIIIIINIIIIIIIIIRRNNTVRRLLVGSRTDCRGKLSDNWPLCKREKTSKEKPFSGCKHGFRRFNFRSGFLAFVCLLINRVQLLGMENII